MINENEAINMAEAFLNAMPHGQGEEVTLMLEHTREFEKGWVFFYQSKRYLETRNIMDMLAGNAPLIVDKMDSSVHVTGTGYPIEKYISEYPGPKKKSEDHDNKS